MIMDYPISRSDFPTRAFFQTFNTMKGEVGSRGVEIGANEEWICAILTQMGYEMVGIDARPFQPPHDDLREPDDRTYPFWTQWQASFDEVQVPAEKAFDFGVSISAIEHFGLGYYEGDLMDANGDVWAMQRVHQWLKPGGLFFVTVPIGIATQTPHWRRYNEAKLRKRIIQDWSVRSMVAYRWVRPDGVEERPLAEAFAWNGVGCDYEVLLVLQNTLTKG